MYYEEKQQIHHRHTHTTSNLHDILDSSKLDLLSQQNELTYVTQG